MMRDREQLRTALASPRSEDARDAARELGAIGTLDDVRVLEQARAEARRYHRELMAQGLAGDREFGCATAHAEAMYQVWSDSIGPFEEGLALLHARLHPDGGVAALTSEGCTVSLLSSHIRWRDDVDLFARLLAVMSRDEGAAFATAFREVSALATCTHPLWQQRAALAIGGWGPRVVISDLAERLDGATDVAAVYGWKPDERRRADLLMASLAFGRAHFGGWTERLLPPALAAIGAAADPRIAPLLDARLADAPPSAGHDQLRAALQARIHRA